MLNPIGAVTFVLEATSCVLRKTDGLRAVTLLACNTFEFVKERGAAGVGSELVGQKVRQIYVFLFGFRIIENITGFANGKAYSDKVKTDHGTATNFNVVRLASRVAFLFNDLFACIIWFEEWGIVAAKTAGDLSSSLFGASPETLLPLVNWIGTGAALADHLRKFANKPSLKITFDLIGDASRLVSIGLTATPGFTPQVIKYGAEVTYSLAIIARSINKYVSQKAAKAA